MNGSYRGLSLWQPWATAIVLGLKRIETRSWSTSYRGPILIHAAKCQNAECKDSWLRLVRMIPTEEKLWRSKGYPTFYQLPFGAFVATAILTDCVPTERAMAGKEERKWGNYTPGRFAWMLGDIVPLLVPVPAIGRQGLWAVTSQLAS